jgi:hypothetical protein
VGGDVKHAGSRELEQLLFGGIRAQEELGLGKQALDGLSFQASAGKRGPGLFRHVCPEGGEEVLEGSGALRQSGGLHLRGGGGLG